MCGWNECISVITISSLNALLRMKYIFIKEMLIVCLYKLFDLPLLKKTLCSKKIIDKNFFRR